MQLDYVTPALPYVSDLLEIADQDVLGKFLQLFGLCCGEINPKQDIIYNRSLLLPNEE